MDKLMMDTTNGLTYCCFCSLFPCNSFPFVSSLYFFLSSFTSLSFNFSSIHAYVPDTTLISILFMPLTLPTVSMLFPFFSSLYFSSFSRSYPLAPHLPPCPPALLHHHHLFLLSRDPPTPHRLSYPSYTHPISLSPSPPSSSSSTVACSVQGWGWGGRGWDLRDRADLLAVIIGAGAVTVHCPVKTVTSDIYCRSIPPL